MRVQIPAHHDYWMRGDRYGETVGQPRLKPVSNGKPNGFRLVEVVSVKLDKSGKTIRVALDDCEVVS